MGGGGGGGRITTSSGALFGGVVEARGGSSAVKHGKGPLSAGTVSDSATGGAGTMLVQRLSESAGAWTVAHQSLRVSNGGRTGRPTIVNESTTDASGVGKLDELRVEGKAGVWLVGGGEVVTDAVVCDDSSARVDVRGGTSLVLPSAGRGRRTLWC